MGMLGFKVMAPQKGGTKKVELQEVLPEDHKLPPVLLQRNLMISPRKTIISNPWLRILRFVVLEVLFSGNIGSIYEETSTYLTVSSVYMCVHVHMIYYLP